MNLPKVDFGRIFLSVLSHVLLTKCNVLIAAAIFLPRPDDLPIPNEPGEVDSWQVAGPGGRQTSTLPPSFSCSIAGRCGLGCCHYRAENLRLRVAQHRVSSGFTMMLRILENSK
jgi:hypothetical protein